MYVSIPLDFPPSAFNPGSRSLSLVEYDCHPTAQEIANDKEQRDDETDDGQVDEIQAVRVPRSVCPARQFSDRYPSALIGMM